MIANFDDFCLWMYVVIDELWQHLAPRFARPGPTPMCSDSELITMAIVGQCRGWELETELISQWQERRDLFPQVPERSRFNRRRRNLMQAFNCVRHLVLRMLDVAQDRYCTIDSLPVPVVQFRVTTFSGGKFPLRTDHAFKAVAQSKTIVGSACCSTLFKAFNRSRPRIYDREHRFSAPLGSVRDG